MAFSLPSSRFQRLVPLRSVHGTGKSCLLAPWALAGSKSSFWQSAWLRHSSCSSLESLVSSSRLCERPAAWVKLKRARRRIYEGRECSPKHCQRSRLATLIPCRSASDGIVGVTSTAATPSWMMPILSAARRDRSRPRPVTNGPRSLTFTFTDLPFRGFVTLITEPIGNVLEAAVSARGLNVSPVKVLRPTKPGPYQEAFRT